MIELLITVGILGVLMAIGALAIRPGPIEVRQATNASSNALTRARLEAIRANSYSTLEYDVASGTLFVCTSAAPITSCDSTSEQVSGNLHLADDFPRVNITVSPSFAVTFDRRGFARFADGSITFATRDGTTFRTLSVSPNGLVTVTGS